MKKLYIAFLGALVAGMACAAPVGHAPQKVSNKKASEIKMNVAPCKTTFKKVSPTAARADEAIENPQGDKRVCSYTGLAIYYGWFGLDAGEISGASDIVYDGNKAYMRGVIGSLPEGYVEGTVSDDGKKITVQLPQVMGYVETYDDDYNPIQYPLYASVMDQIEVDGYVDFVPEVPVSNVVEYTVNDDGTVAMTPFQDDFIVDEDGYLEFPEKYLTCYIKCPKSLVADLEEGEEDVDIEYWYYDGNITQVFSPLPDDLVVYDIPADLDWEQNWRLVSANDNNVLCNVAFKDNKVYVDGLVPGADAVIVGEMADGKVTFKDRQYMGIHEGYDQFIFLLGCNIEEAYDEYYEDYYTNYVINGEDMVFTWNADKKEMAFVGANKGILFNADLKEIYYYDGFAEPVFSFQSDEELCVAPPAPGIEYYQDYDVVMLDFNNQLENGVILNPYNMSFEMYINGELNVFDADDYGLEEDMTEVPCYFDNMSLACYGNVAYIELFDGGIESIGVRTINNAPDGKKYYSDIVTYDVAGLQTIEAAQDVKATRYFDLQGRPVANPTAGSLVIKVMTLGDGSNKAVKVVK